MTNDETLCMSYHKYGLLQSCVLIQNNTKRGAGVWGEIRLFEHFCWDNLLKCFGFYIKVLFLSLEKETVGWFPRQGLNKLMDKNKMYILRCPPKLFLLENKGCFCLCNWP